MNFDIEIPKDTKWIAQDADGKWYAYYEEPVIREDEWVPQDTNIIVARYVGIGPKPKDFTKTLWEIEWA